VLLDPSVLSSLQHSFAARGPQGLALFHVFFEAVKVSLASAIDSIFLLGFIVMLLGLLSVLFLREIPLRKSHSAQAAPETPSGPNRSRALLGLTLAFLAREAQKPQADPAIVATLSNTINGRYPHTWSDEERARAVAQDIIEPLSITLLASSVSNGHANGAAQTTERTSSGVDDTFSTGSTLG
jgi:hypothetical protein